MMNSKLLLLSFLWTQPTNAALTATPYAVNMQDGGLIVKENQDSQGGSFLNVERTYRSRSLYKGYFGQGWCTDFEAELQFQDKGVVRLENCHSPRPSLFKLSSTASSYINMEDPKDIIKIRMGYYERVHNGKPNEKFNFQGRLTEVKIKQTKWQLQYGKRNLPIQINNDEGLLLQLKWHPILALIEKVEINPTRSLHFQYEGFNLKKVHTQNGKNQKSLIYQYDDLDNLILRKSSDRTIRFEHNKELDQILKVYNLNCEEEYEFKPLVGVKKFGLLKRLCHPQQNSLNDKLNPKFNKQSDQITRIFEFEYDSQSRKLAQVKVEDHKSEFKKQVATRPLELE